MWKWNKQYVMSVAQTGCPSVYLWKLKTSPCSVYEWYLLVLYIIYIYYLITPCVFNYFFLTFFCWIWIHWTQGQWLMCLFVCLIWTVSAASHLHVFILFCWHKHVHILWVSIHVVTSLFSSVQKIIIHMWLSTKE